MESCLVFSLQNLLIVRKKKADKIINKEKLNATDSSEIPNGFIKINIPIKPNNKPIILIKSKLLFFDIK